MGRKKKGVSLEDALENLKRIDALSLQNPPLLGVQGDRILQEDEGGEGFTPWLSSEGAEELLTVLDATYLAVQVHLDSLGEEVDSKEVHVLMELVGESAFKMERYLSFRMGRPCTKEVSGRASFQKLRRLYADHFDQEKSWSEGWEGQRDTVLFDAEQSGFKDFQTVIQDEGYELFYLLDEQEQPYFNEELLRNLKLTVDFQLQSSSFEEDPLLKVRALQDRDLLATADQILTECREQIEGFYKLMRQTEETELVQSLNRALIALFLAANPHHLLQTTAGKSCLQYFEDFHHFLRNSMHAAEYQKLLAYPPAKSDQAFWSFLHLIHSLCHAFFYRVGGVKQEVLGLLHRAKRKGEEKKQAEKKKLFRGDSVWMQMMLADENLRGFLSQFPNGPLLKTLDVIREQQEGERAIFFDPLFQGNLPACLHCIQMKKHPCFALRLPCPTRQNVIDQAVVVEEFLGFLRSLVQKKPSEKFLLIQLQDHQYFHQAARARSLEKLSQRADVAEQFFLIGLSKESPFYHQSQEPGQMSFQKFFSQIEHELSLRDKGSFFLGHSQQEMSLLIRKLLPLIHEHFFAKSAHLSQREREDFIEILYQWIILKALELSQADSFSFVCKDGIDVGACQQAIFYGFLHLFKKQEFSKEDQEHLTWLFYSPALLIRERAVHGSRFQRALCALQQMDRSFQKDRDKILHAFSSVYGPQFLQSLSVSTTHPSL